MPHNRRSSLDLIYDAPLFCHSKTRPTLIQSPGLEISPGDLSHLDAECIRKMIFHAKIVLLIIREKIIKKRKKGRRMPRTRKYKLSFLFKLCHVRY